MGEGGRKYLISHHDGGVAPEGVGSDINGGGIDLNSTNCDALLLEILNGEVIVREDSDGDVAVRSVSALERELVHSDHNDLERENV